MKTKKQGSLITSIEKLLQQEKSVWFAPNNKPIPMAFIMGMPLRIVLLSLKAKQYYTVENIKNGNSFKTPVFS